MLSDVPDEELAALPVNGAAQVSGYIFGNLLITFGVVDCGAYNPAAAAPSKRSRCDG
jgi:hypothetical protein